MVQSSSGEFVMRRKYLKDRAFTYSGASFKIGTDGIGELGLPTHRRPASQNCLKFNWKAAQIPQLFSTSNWPPKDVVEILGKSQSSFLFLNLVESMTCLCYSSRLQSLFSAVSCVDAIELLGRGAAVNSLQPVPASSSNCQ